MVFSKKPQVGRGLDTDGKRWVFADISIRASLKPVKTKFRKPERETEPGEEGCEQNNVSEGCCVTPTAKGAKTPEKPKCPPAPRKCRPALKCRSNVVVEYFVPPSDLETVFVLRR